MWIHLELHNGVSALDEQNVNRVNNLPDYEITDADSIIVFMQFNIGMQMLSNTLYCCR